MKSEITLFVHNFFLVQFLIFKSLMPLRPYSKRFLIYVITQEWWFCVHFTHTEAVMEATPHKTVAVRPPNTRQKNYPS